MRGKLDWSVEGRFLTWFWTITGTLGCVLIALAVDYPNFITLDAAGRSRALLVNTLLPTILAGPALFLLMSKIRQLAITQRELTVLASTDSLTGVLNRGAFTMLVEAYLAETRKAAEDVSGALLVVDADHFKAINDMYGHDQGDAALRIVAQAIKSVLRGADIVGRIGGEEFGVFLPGAEGVKPESVAERIREAVQQAIFQPEGPLRMLSVSVGGAVFRGPITYDELFRAADRRLYEAKESGRNQVAIGYAAAA